MKKRIRECDSFGRLVRSLRERRGLSQETFADKAGVHRTYIGSIERGERNPTLTMIWRIAHALNVSASSLLKPLK
jgi:transcriptional regulator with XRE-family HTH domain